MKFRRPTIAAFVACLFVILAFVLFFSAHFVYGLLAMIIAVIPTLIHLKKKKQTMRFGKRAIAILIVIAISTLAYRLWSFDASSIIDDYTIKDLNSAPSEYNYTYNLLMLLADKDANSEGAPAIGLTSQDISTIKDISLKLRGENLDNVRTVISANSLKILYYWYKAKSGRNVIEKLAQVSYTADISEPDIKSDIPFLANLIRLSKVYEQYVILQVELRNFQESVEKLTQIHAIFRNLSVNSRDFITKIVCMASMTRCFEIANYLANHPQISEAGIEQLTRHFQPLSGEQLSFRNSFIFEYLKFKRSIQIDIGRKITFGYTPFLKSNSTLRLYKNLLADWIIADSPEFVHSEKKFTVWPALYFFMPQINFDYEDYSLPFYYKIYNPIGSKYLSSIVPNFDGCLQIKKKAEIYDALLQIVFDLRREKKPGRNAKNKDIEYHIDIAKKVILNSGVDQKLNTDDDLKLHINPKVLGLLNNSDQ